MWPLNEQNIKLACSKSEEEQASICNRWPINETKGYTNRIQIEEIPVEDWLVLSFYFCLIIGIALVSSFRNRGSLSGFFLTARSTNWVLIGMSMCSSNIGSSHFVGLAGTAAAYGIRNFIYELGALFFLPLLSWFFTPVYLASNVATMPEYLKARFGGRRIEIYVACNALILFIFTKLSTDLYSGALYLSLALGFNRYLSIILLLAVAAFFTIIGGMTAVLWTSAGQLILVFTGCLYFLGRVFTKTGGIEAMFENFVHAKPNFSLFMNVTGHSPEAFEAIEKCGNPPSPDEAFHLIQPANDENAPWPGIIFGLSILNTWYWCCNQVITQHVLASKNLSHAKLGSILTAVFKIIASFIFVLPGMASRVLYPACSDPVLCCCYCGSETGCTNYAYILLAADNDDKDKLLSSGTRGLMAVAVVSAIVSSFTAIFNACSAIFTMDIWRLFRPRATSKELHIVGRVFIVIVCTISTLWMVIINNTSNLYSYIQSITADFSPPLSAVFLLAIFWKRCNEQGVFYGLMVGLIIGIVRFALEFGYSLPGCAENHLTKHDIRPPALKNVHYLHFAMICFSMTAATTICLSLVGKAPDKCRINGLTYWTRYEHRIQRRPKMKKKTSKVSENNYSTPGENDNDDNKGVANRESNDQAFTSVGYRLEQQEGNRGEQNRNDNKKRSKWRHLVRWLCGIESLNEAHDLDIMRPRPTVNNDQHPPSDHHRAVQEQDGPRSMSTATIATGTVIVPIANGLFEEPWLETVASVALVALFTLTVANMKKILPTNTNERNNYF